MTVRTVTARPVRRADRQDWWAWQVEVSDRRDGDYRVVNAGEVDPEQRLQTIRFPTEDGDNVYRVRWCRGAEHQAGPVERIA